MLIKNTPAFRFHDPTVHCGGRGLLIVGSRNVLVGDKGCGSHSYQGPAWIEIELHDEQGKPAACERYRIEMPGGGVIEGFLNADGFARVEGLEPGSCEVTFPALYSDCRHRA